MTNFNTICSMPRTICAVIGAVLVGAGSIISQSVKKQIIPNIRRAFDGSITPIAMWAIILIAYTLLIGVAIAGLIIGIKLAPLAILAPITGIIGMVVFTLVAIALFPLFEIPLNFLINKFSKDKLNGKFPTA